jgi:hypothetical protein
LRSRWCVGGEQLARRGVIPDASASHIGGMTEPELSDEETRTLVDYARRKFAEVDLRAVRIQKTRFTYSATFSIDRR